MAVDGLVTHMSSDPPCPASGRCAAQGAVLPCDLGFQHGGLGQVGASIGHQPVGAGSLLVSQEDVTIEGHSIGELAMSHGP